MKKLLVTAAALLLAATPAAAQQAAESPSGDVPSVQQSSSFQVGQPALNPALYVSPDEVRQAVAAQEAAREGAQIGDQRWWGLVLAIALGVLIALLLFD